LSKIQKVNGNTAIFHLDLELFTLNGQSLEKEERYVLMTFDLAQQKIRRIKHFSTKELTLAYLKQSRYPELKEEL